MQFSIIVPIYKVEQFIRKCVDSILAQTFSDFEVILVDDGSPDRCPEICDDYAKKDSHVRVIHKPNGGLVSARNAGIFAAKGDYITYVDGDDWVRPNMLQFVHDRMEEATEPLDMVIFAAEKVYSDHNEPLPNNVAEGWYNRERLEREIFPYLLINRTKGFDGHMMQAYTWNKVCRRELQQEYYVRDEGIRVFTDIPITYECMLNCNSIYICNEPLYFYNKTNESSIVTLNKQNFLTKSFDCLAAYFADRLKRYDVSIQRQWNDYLAHLVVLTCMREISEQPSFRMAVKDIRTKLKTSHLLHEISLNGLLSNPNLFVILLFKLHMYSVAMYICTHKRHITKAREKRKGK